ncbi:MAG TPA: hypothetical protein VFZ95_10225 [Steroidobacteraceae bacterium]
MKKIRAFPSCASRGRGPPKASRHFRMVRLLQRIHQTERIREIQMKKSALISALLR